MKRLILGLVLAFPVGTFGAAPAACNGQGASPGTYDAVHVAYGNVEITATVFQPVDACTGGVEPGEAQRHLLITEGSDTRCDSTEVSLAFDPFGFPFGFGSSAHTGDSSPPDYSAACGVHISVSNLLALVNPTTPDLEDSGADSGGATVAFRKDAPASGNWWYTDANSVKQFADVPAGTQGHGSRGVRVVLHP